MIEDYAPAPGQPGSSAFWQRAANRGRLIVGNTREMNPLRLAQRPLRREEIFWIVMRFTVSRPGQLLLALLTLSCCLSNVSSQQKKTEIKDAPRVTVANPIGITPGKTSGITLRGLHLDTAKELRCREPNVQVKILTKSKVVVPNQQEAAKVGDTQIECEVTLPSGVKGETISFVVVGPAGEGSAHKLLINAAPATKDKEPNNGFAEAQAIQIPQIIDGVIDRPQDVDVFRFEGTAGQKLVCEVQAARYGSGLDSLLTLYDASRRQLACNDDFENSLDSQLSLTLPRTGTYYLSLTDAQDQGGPAHVYRLVVRVDKSK